MAEFGINTFDNAPTTPAPSRQTEKAKSRNPKTPKTKRKEKDEQEGCDRKAKTRRDSEPTQVSEEPKSENNKENKEPSKYGSLFDSLSCGQCGSGFANLMEYIGHKKICVPPSNKDCKEKEATNMPREDKEPPTQASEPKVQSSNTETENNATSKICDSTQLKQKETKSDEIKSQSPLKMADVGKSKNSSSGLCCEKCDEKFTSMVKYEKHRSQCYHTK